MENSGKNNSEVTENFVFDKVMFDNVKRRLINNFNERDNNGLLRPEKLMWQATSAVCAAIELDCLKTGEVVSIEQLGKKGKPEPLAKKT